MQLVTLLWCATKRGFLWGNSYIKCDIVNSEFLWFGNLLLCAVYVDAVVRKSEGYVGIRSVAM